MRFLIYLIFFLISFGQLLRISLFNNQINFYLYELFIIVFCLYSLLKFKKDFINIFFLNYKVELFFLIILLISLVFNFNKFTLFQNLVGSLYFLRLVLYFLFLFSLNYWINIDKNNLLDLKKGINLFILLTLFSTLIQYFLYPDLRNLIYQGWDPHYYRTFGVFFDTSIAATIYGLIFFIADNFFIKLIFLIFLGLSYSRNIYLGFFITIIYLYFFKKKNFSSIFLITIIVLLTVIFILPKPKGEGGKLTRSYSIVARINDFKKGINLFLKQPIFGYGYNRIRYIKNESSLNSGASFSSSYLTILVSSGILGFLSLLLWLLNFWRKYPYKRFLLVFIYLVSLFDNILFHPFILLIFFSSLFDKRF